MQQHLLDHDLASVLHTQGDHSKAVADEHDVHARRVGHVRRREVVCRHDGDGFIPPVHRAQRAERDLFPIAAGALGPQRRVRAASALRCLVEGEQGSSECCGSDGGKGGCPSCRQ